jgi:Cu2+-exporting ATPase
MPDGTLNRRARGGKIAAAAAVRDLPAAATDCFHCGLPLPAAGERWQVTISGAPRAMCCPGCAAVAQTIVDLGQDDYYRNRSAFAGKVDAAQLVPPELALYDNADPRFQLDEDSREATFTLEGIRCAACVWLVEQRLGRLPGVQAATLNVATERLYVRWSRADCTPAAILRAVREIGYTAYPYDAARHGEQLRRSTRILGRQLFVAGLSMMQVMMYVAPAYLSNDDGTLDPSMASLMRWASLLLTLPALCYSAQPFFAGAWASLRARALGMDVPVTLGIVAAFGASVVATFRGSGEVYFDSVTMFIFLLLCSRYYELRARRQAASALERLQHALPASASRVPGYPANLESFVVAAGVLAAGDVLLVKPGEAAAADCVIVEGDSSFDLSLLTGESAPQQRGAGAEVQGGAINIRSAVFARVTRPASESTLADLVRLVQKAGQHKPRLALWADQVAAWFVAGLLLFALGCLAYWQLHDAARAWPIAIAVLVVSCPCALSLATPCALAAANDSLLRRGVLAVGPHTLETLRRATHVVFDKTGTLTEGKPVLQGVDMLADGPGMSAAACLEIAAALEAGSAHPLARAIIEAAAVAPRGGRTPSVATEVVEVPGMGLEGTVQGRRYRLGSAAHVAPFAERPGAAHVAAPCASAAAAAQSLSVAKAAHPTVAAAQPLSATAASHGVPPAAAASALPAAPEGMTALYLAAEGMPLACLLLQDAVRADALATVGYFRQLGKHLVVLSGDADDITTRVAGALGIADAHGGCLPADKLARVQQLQRDGAIVAMVGDGINDAAVLSAADVSFAMGAGAALAQAHADAVLLSGRLGSLADTARIAQRSMNVIRQNLGWAMLYNLIAIPAAAIGWLNPWLSGAGMALSSAVVVANALRLRRA